MKTKKMADGGGTGYPTPPTYPFYGNQLTPNNTAPNGNIQPASQPMQPLAAPQPTQMNKGGKVGNSMLKTEMAKLDKASDTAPLGRRDYKETMRDLAIDKRRAAMDKGDNSEAFSLMGDSISKRKDIEGGKYRRELSTGERESLQNAEDAKIRAKESAGMKKAKGGTVKMAKGGSVRSSASRRGDGIAQRGKTKGRIV
jgi:hypothetical protein